MSYDECVIVTQSLSLHGCSRLILQPWNVRECFWLVPTLSKLGYIDILLGVFCWQNPPSAADGTSHVWYRSTILLKPLLGTRLVEDIVYLFVTSLYASVVSHVFSCYELPYLLWAWLDGTNVLTLTLLLVDFNNNCLFSCILQRWDFLLNAWNIRSGQLSKTGSSPWKGLIHEMKLWMKCEYLWRRAELGRIAGAWLVRQHCQCCCNQLV